MAETRAMAKLFTPTPTGDQNCSCAVACYPSNTIVSAAYYIYWNMTGANLGSGGVQGDFTINCGSQNGNGDGWIDAQDAIWEKLLLWQDANHNGVTDNGELHALDELGIKRISIRYHEDRKVDKYGNIFRYEAAINDASTDHRTY